MNFVEALDLIYFNNEYCGIMRSGNKSLKVEISVAAFNRNDLYISRKNSSMGWTKGQLTVDDYLSMDWVTYKNTWF